MTTREALKNVRRPVQAVELPGGDTVHVRSLSVADLRRVDARLADTPVSDERNVRVLLLISALGLCAADGTPFYPEATDADLADVEQFTPDQLEAVVTAAVPSKGDAKN